jgi:hypothetical protein
VLAHAAAVGLEGQVKADGIVDVVDQTRAGLGCFRDAASWYLVNDLNDAGFGETPLIPSSGQARIGSTAYWGGALPWVDSAV